MGDSPVLHRDREEGQMANKDKGGKSSKKAASQGLKEKRAAKKSKKAAKAKKNSE
jgi:hypothetical protein